MSPQERMQMFAGISPSFGGPTKLHAGDFKYEVNVMHHDGSRFKLSEAFAVKWREWYFVFTEHTGYLIFHEEEVDISQWENRIREEDQEMVSKNIKIPPIDEWKGEGDLYDK